jgi:hypothetical protein
LGDGNNCYTPPRAIAVTALAAAILRSAGDDTNAQRRQPAMTPGVVCSATS